mmetsp:Transcript_8570/g.17897  ORF Transcript_8570/g.17897 Transcript_8570/m.17897 type:complete len:81 (+) Transcript_8570:552-794(+)
MSISDGVTAPAPESSNDGMHRAQRYNPTNSNKEGGTNAGKTGPTAIIDSFYSREISGGTLSGVLNNITYRVNLQTHNRRC